MKEYKIFPHFAICLSPKCAVIFFFVSENRKYRLKQFCKENYIEGARIALEYNYTTNIIPKNM